MLYNKMINWENVNLLESLVIEAEKGGLTKQLDRNIRDVAIKMGILGDFFDHFREVVIAEYKAQKHFNKVQFCGDDYAVALAEEKLEWADKDYDELVFDELGLEIED